MKALWNGTVIAQSKDIEEIDGNFYFPLDSLNKKYFTESKTRSSCPWKGKAWYLNIVVDGETNEDAAWYYPKKDCKSVMFSERVAFWKGVELKESNSLINFDLLNVLNSFF